MGRILAIQSLCEMTEDLRYLHEVKWEQKRSLWWLVLVSLFHTEWSFLTPQDPQTPEGGEEGDRATASCSSKPWGKLHSSFVEIIQHDYFFPTGIMTRNIKYSWSWLNTRRSMQPSWKGTEQSLQGLMPGFISLHRGPLSFHLTFETLRYHFIHFCIAF